MRFGLDEHTINKLIAAFEANPKVDKALVFGSRAKGNYRDDSDIDIAVKGQNITLDDILTMSVAFEDKGITHKVDLLDYNTINEKDLVDHIDRVGIEFYSRWKKYLLNKITEPIKDTYIPDGSNAHLYIGLEHIEQETLRLNSIGVSSDVTSNKFKFKTNDILFGKLRPYFRKVVKPQFDGICSTDIWVFRAKKGFDQNYLFYFLANKEFVDTANSGESGSRMPRADWHHLKDTSWQCPPLPEQTTIASILSSLDDKIDLLHKQNKTLEQMAETLFRQWFIDEAKENWEQKSLVDIAQYLNGLALQKYPSKGFDSLPVIKIREMKQGITENTDKCSKNIPLQYIIQDGDILFSWSGSLEVVIWSGGEGALNQHLFNVTSKKYPKWLYYLATKYHLAGFKAIAESKSTTMGHIQREHLNQAMISLPPKSLFDEYDSSISPLIEKRIDNNKQIRTLSHLRDTLLPKLMSGEVRVKIKT